VQNISKNYEQILITIFGGVRRGQRNKQLDIGGNPDLLPHFTPIFLPNDGFSMG